MARYFDIAARYPLRTQGLTVLVLGSAADVACQVIEGARSVGEWEAARTARFDLYRVCVSWPCYATWLSWMDRVNLSTARRTVVARLGLDFFIYAPTFQSVFFMSMALLEGQSPSRAWERCVETIPHSLPASYAFWLPMQICTFTIIPTHLRIAWVNTGSLLWNVALSFLNQRARVYEGGAACAQVVTQDGAGAEGTPPPVQKSD